MLTTGWCPFVATMSSAIPDRLRALDGVQSVDVQVVWDPVWTPERLSPSARDALSMPLEQLEPYRERRLAAETSLTMATETAPHRQAARERKVDAFVFDCVCHIFNFDPANAIGPPGQMFDEHLYAFHQLLTKEGERSSRARSS